MAVKSERVSLGWTLHSCDAVSGKAGDAFGIAGCVVLAWLPPRRVPHNGPQGGRRGCRKGTLVTSTRLVLKSSHFNPDTNLE
jgi:hypothetical protein